MKILTRIVVGYAGLVSLIGTLLSLMGGYYSVLLYKNLRTDIEELLPTSARSVKDLDEVTHRLESIDNMVVLVFSDHPAASKRFVQDLAKGLEKYGKKTISSVEYRIDKEYQFFKDRRALYIDLSDLKTIRNYIRDRIEYEKELYNPLNIFQQEEKVEPKLDYQGIKDKYKNKMAGYDHFPGGYYSTIDEKIRAAVVYMPGKGLEKAKRMREAVDLTVASLNPKSYAPDLEIKYTGNVENMLEESAALIEDLEISTVIVMVLVSIFMVVFYRSVVATFALMASLLIGTFWTFGVSYFAVGYLNANSAFLASIVIGNGVNFGIIFLARYLEERRRGLKNNEAIGISMASTASSTATAALAAALSYGSLMLTGFRGFSQFGVIGFTGMVLCWVSSYTLLPAFLTLMDRWFGSRWISTQKHQPWVSGTLATIVKKAPRLIWITSALGVILSFALLARFQGNIIETDLTKLRDKRSMEKGSGALYHYIDDIFKHSFSPMVILPKDRKDTRKIAELLRKKKQEEGKASLLTTIQTLDDFIPRDQKKKVEVLQEIRRLLPKRFLDKMSAEDRAAVADLLNPKALAPFREGDLPKLVLSKFTELDRSVGRMVLVDKKIDKNDDSTSVAQFVTLGRDVADSVVPNVPVAGDLPISFDMFGAILTDGPKATAFAFIAVVILVICLFREVEIVTMVLLSLVLGVSWLMGVMLAWNLKINFLNFIALPITFGIGVDYGVNMFQRYRQEGSSNIIDVIRTTGGAVLLSSMTTTIGYGSLLIAGNQAFVSFGRLAVLGELTCVTAAIISIPAFLFWWEGRKMKSASLSVDHV